MKRKLFLGMVIVLGSLCLVACGSNEKGNSESAHSEISSSDKGGTSESESMSEPESTEKVGLKELFSFMGYTFNCPTDVEVALIDTVDYGNAFMYKDCMMFVEAPATVGEIFEVQQLSALPEACDKYIYETIEGKIHYIFNSDSTEHQIRTSKTVDVNGLEMLRTEGTLFNTYKNEGRNCVVYYALVGDNGNLPMYIYGFAKDADKDVTAIVDELVSYITK